MWNSRPPSLRIWGWTILRLLFLWLLFGFKCISCIDLRYEMLARGFFLLSLLVIPHVFPRVRTHIHLQFVKIGPPLRFALYQMVSKKRLWKSSFDQYNVCWCFAKYIARNKYFLESAHVIFMCQKKTLTKICTTEAEQNWQYIYSSNITNYMPNLHPIIITITVVNSTPLLWK